MEPLHRVGVERAGGLKSRFGLVVHDWCKLSYAHVGKEDLLQVTHESDIGYDLTTSLLVSSDDGSPLAPLEVRLRTGRDVWSTRCLSPAEKEQDHLEQLLPVMEASRSWGLACELVHVIDREADSVGHYRDWDQAGHRYLVRGDDRRVRWKDGEYLLSEIHTYLQERGQFERVGEAVYRGKRVGLWVVESEVTLDRPAKKRVCNKQISVPGAALKLRCVFVELRSEKGRCLAHWILLSNVPREWATTEHLARCYYWRWRIESFFKLLKSHGQQIEEWQQQSGKAIAKRLLIAAMSCVIVWQLQEDPSAQAKQFKDILIKLSGRQMKRNRPHTAPALLNGLEKLLSVFSLLEHYDLHQLKQLAKSLPFSSA